MASHRAEGMKRDQTAHERLIPLLVEILGVETYLEFGTHHNETISKVSCKRRLGVDTNAQGCEGVEMFRMTTQEFIETKAAGLAPFDFVFIDSDHSAESIRRDFGGIWPFVSEEGIVAVHDCNPQTIPDTASGYCGDAWKWAASAVTTGLEAIILPYHPGLALVRKRAKWGPTP